MMHLLGCNNRFDCSNTDLDERGCEGLAAQNQTGITAGEGWVREEDAYQCFPLIRYQTSTGNCRADVSDLFNEKKNFKAAKVLIVMISDLHSLFAAR